VIQVCKASPYIFELSILLYVNFNQIALLIINKVGKHGFGVPGYMMVEVGYWKIKPSHTRTFCLHFMDVCSFLWVSQAQGNCAFKHDLFETEFQAFLH